MNTQQKLERELLLDFAEWISLVPQDVGSVDESVDNYLAEAKQGHPLSPATLARIKDGAS